MSINPIGFLSGIWQYVLAGLGAALLAVSVFAVIQTNRMHTAHVELESANTKLAVSNASISDLSKQLNGVLKDLQTAQVHDQQSQEALRKALKEQEGKDQSLTELEQRLRNKTNASVSTPIDKDIIDAWHSL